MVCLLEKEALHVKVKTENEIDVHPEREGDLY